VSDRKELQTMLVILLHRFLHPLIRDATNSEPASRFVERMLSVLATWRQQKRNILKLLAPCCRPRRDASDAPL